MIIVYGGAFNPPTLGHLEVYRFLKEKIGFERFIYLPVGKAYYKSIEGKDLDRINMLKCMTKDLADVEISDIEMHSNVYLGTYHSLKVIETNYHQRIVFAMGADHLDKLTVWKNAEALLSEFSFIILNRKRLNLSKIIENDAMLMEHIDKLKIFEDFDFSVSSSLFRQTKDKSLLHPAVYEYIVTHQLYKR